MCVVWAAGHSHVLMRLCVHVCVCVCVDMSVCMYDNWLSASMEHAVFFYSTLAFAQHTSARTARVASLFAHRGLIRKRWGWLCIYATGLVVFVCMHANAASENIAALT